MRNGCASNCSWLVPGALYEFQVHGVGKDGDGPFSDIAVKRAP